MKVTKTDLPVEDKFRLNSEIGYVGQFWNQEKMVFIIVGSRNIARTLHDLKHKFGRGRFAIVQDQGMRHLRYGMSQ